MIKKIRTVVFIVALVALDQITKYLIASSFSLGESKEVIARFFYLTYVCNTGAAWSMLSGQLYLFYIISIVAIGFFIYFLRHSETKLERIGILMMLAGTIGNFIDRLAYQHVRDFLDFYIFGYDYPIFNIADCELVIGVGLILISILFVKKVKHE